MKYIALIVTLCLVGCWTDDNECIKALYDNGFSDPVINNKGAVWAFWHGCDDKDQNWYEVTATNPVGRKVNVVVCCGGPVSLKGCTIRSK